MHQIDLHVFGSDVLQMQTKSNSNTLNSRNLIFEISIVYI